MGRYTAFPDTDSESDFSELDTGYSINNAQKSNKMNNAGPGPRTPPATAPSGGLQRQASTSSTGSVYFPGAYRETYDEPKPPPQVADVDHAAHVPKAASTTKKRRCTNLRCKCPDCPHNQQRDQSEDPAPRTSRRKADSKPKGSDEAKAKRKRKRDHTRKKGEEAISATALAA